ncbi:hypothetical protein 10RS306A_gene4593 [Ralstonia phage 10RS306A]|uniref:Uncharacterized protein n=1 Tax=Ralstonia phage 10RS306A TaxID=2968818 RepID=A0A977TFK9_9CAUD|nr:hypothetical protein 10RS306A_gene4593 [Ralstonia phage 10RS306A]UYE93696.1 hypothetical protein 10RS305A_4596 [Ralstonia phage 10RS305A]
MDDATRQRALDFVKGIGLAADHPGAGKDTAFAALVQANPNTEFVNIKFADALTAEVRALFPRVSDEEFTEIRNDPKFKDLPLWMFAIHNIARTEQGMEYVAFLKERHPELIRQRLSIRQHLLIYGTEYVREFKGDEDRWLNLGVQAADKAAAAGLVPVITDVRFPNEAKKLKQAGYDIAHIAADGLANAALSALTGIAEGHLKDWDFDLRVKNVWGKPENMGVQFNAKYRW